MEMPQEVVAAIVGTASVSLFKIGEILLRWFRFRDTDLKHIAREASSSQKTYETIYRFLSDEREANKALREELDRQRAELARMRRELETETRARKKLEKDLEMRDVTISHLRTMLQNYQKGRA